MANAKLAARFWKTVKSVSVKEIAREANRPFGLAVVGDPDARLRILQKLFPAADNLDVLPGRSLIRTFDSTSAEDDFPRGVGSFDIVVDAGGGRVDPPEGLRLYSLTDLGDWDRLAQRILEDRADLHLSLARRFPGFRDLVADRIIHDTSVANAEFALISGLPAVVPIIGPFLPPAVIGDIFMLTKNQAMMMYRLAAIYQLPLDVSSRAADLGPIVAQAFGWRTLAREVIGMVPGGVGLAARGSIAFAGTMAVGRALHGLYGTGKKPTRAQIREYYRQSLAAGREAAGAIRRRLIRPSPRRVPFRRAIESRDEDAGV